MALHIKKMKKKNKKKKKIDKKQIVITSILSRITDFQLQSNDDDFCDWIEDLRECIVKFEERGNKNGKIKSNSI